MPRFGPIAVTALAALLASALTPAPTAAHRLPRVSGMQWLVGPQPAIGGSAARVRAVASSGAGTTPARYGDCGPGARPETGLQGQVPRADQDSGRSKAGYHCNLRRVGGNDIATRGANFQLAYYKDCAYVGIVGDQIFQSATSTPPHPLEGVAVIDAADAAAPEVVRILQSPAGRTQHEAIEVNRRRGMLVVAIGGLQAQWIEIYDVSSDCRSPVLRARYDAGRPIYHGLRISDDGRTVYLSDNYGVSGPLFSEVLQALDVTDMTAPRLIATWDPTHEGSGPYGVHDLELSPDGRRAYLGVQPYESGTGLVLGGPPSNSDGPSMVVLDTSEVQERRPNSRMRAISEIRLANFGHAVQRARINGRPYLLSSGESVGARAENCPWAWGHVLDMSDELRPRAVSELKLEVNDQANCERMRRDGAVYSIHYVGVDDDRRTKMAFYTYYTGGLRVFDVSDPGEPVEIAYYHPPPVAQTVFQPTGTELGDKQTPQWDSATSVVRYRPRRRQLWFASIGGGFHILELTGSARPSAIERPRCVRARQVVLRLTLRPGERIRRLRARVDGRVATARRRGRARVVVRLGRRATARRRVTVVARTTQGRRLVVRRRLPPSCR